MTDSTARPTTISRLRTVLTPAARNPIARELGEFRSQSELAELSALLDRYSDADAEPLRDLVDFTAAA